MYRFDHLLRPGSIGPLKLRNRMIASAIVTQYCTEDGMPTERYIRYHEEKARGGWGLVVTEDYAVEAEGKSFARIPGLWSDAHIEPHRTFVERVHAAGGTLCVQLFHPGRQAPAALSGGSPFAPSALREPSMATTPRAMSRAEIARVVSSFGEAARRARACGFDAVEIHGAHGYLVNEFLSAFANKRTDEYGGTLRNRARFALEVVDAVRAAIGPDMALIFRLSVNDGVPGGISPIEAAAFARLLERADVDLLSCSQGNYASKELIIPPSAIAPGSFVQDAASVKRSVRIPTAAVGRINDPYAAEEVLARGDADFVVMARASLADPELPAKIASGRENEVVRCIGCGRGCTGQNARGKAITCMVNPFVGREEELGRAANNPHTVAVVGAGVAGCVFSLVAAARGHRVVLFERSGDIGGQWNIAAVPPGKEDYLSFVVSLKQALVRSSVEIRLNETFDGLTKLESSPDVVVIAAGSAPLVPHIAGIEGNPRVHDARDVLSGAVTVSGNVAVLGGGLVGAETAETLAVAGCGVSVFEMAPDIASDAEASPRKLLLRSLADHGVQLHPNCRVVEVDAGRIVTESPEGRRQRFAGFDAIVTAFGSTSNADLLGALDGRAETVIAVGDANGVKDGFDNIQEAFEAALAL